MNGWRTHRDGSLTEWDDYELSDSWSGERTIWETPVGRRGFRSNLRQTGYGDPTCCRLALKIFVTGRRSGSPRLRPTHVRPTLHFSGHRMDLSQVRCTSVLDAERQADAHPELEIKAQQLMKLAFSKRMATCVYRKADGSREHPGATIWERLQGAEGWSPWATMFGTYPNTISWPVGKYAIVTPEPDGPKAAYYEITTWCSSGCHTPKKPELESWFSV